MKAKLTQNTEFKPIDLTITFESQEEFNQILLMSCYQKTIPDMVSKNYKDIKMSTVEKFLCEIYSAMANK